MASSETKDLKAQREAYGVLPEYSIQDVSAHNTKSDAWIIIHGQVFDITKYTQDHPGGTEVLVEVAGLDATAAYEDVGHSEDACEIMQPYLVGTLKDAQQYVLPKSVRVVSQSMPEPTKTSTIGTTVVVTGALGVIIPAIYIYSPGTDLFNALGSISHIFPRQLKTIRLPRNGFMNGFLTASLICSAIGVFIAKQASRLVQIQSTRYPPRIKAQKVIRVDPHLTHGFLDSQTYQDLPLVAKRQLSPNVYRFVIGLPNPNTVLGLPIGQHVAIKAIVDGTTVTRSYTPTSNNCDRGRLELVVKCYPDGLMSRYLSGLEIGEQVLFRGPKGAMKYTKGFARHLGMIAGGTGITPMYQLIRAICEDDTDTTQITLVYANRSESDILLRKELDAFARKYPNNFKIWYVLNTAPENWAYTTGFVDVDVLREHMPARGPATKVLLCGPPGMIGAMKKNLATLGFKTSGSVSKMSDEVFCF